MAPAALVRLGRSVGLARQRVGGPGGTRARVPRSGRCVRYGGGNSTSAPARAPGARARLRLSGGVQPAQGGDVPPRREEHRLPRAGPGGPCAARRLGGRCAVSARSAGHRPRRAGRDLRDHRQRRRSRALRTAPPWPTDAPTVLFVGRHEPRKGLGRPARGVRSARGRYPPWRSVGGGGRTRDRQAPRAPSAQRPRGVAGPDRRRRAGVAPARRPRAVRPVARGRVLRHGPARGHGGAHGGGGERHPRVPRRGRRATASRAPGDVGGPGACPRGAVADAAARHGHCAPAALDAAFAHASHWSMPKVAASYLAVYERVCAGA